jgi:hypothetical protein
MDKNSVLFGMVLGAITPVIGYVIVEQLFALMVQSGIMPEAPMSIDSQRMRTITLIAICSSLIPFEYCRSQRYDEAIRGIVLPTLIYVGFWIYKFHAQLF